MSNRRSQAGSARDESNAYSFSVDDVRAALIDRFGDALVEQGTGYLKAPCLHPDHDDDNPSMSVSAKDGGRVLVKCHAGCEQAE